MHSNIVQRLEDGPPLADEITDYFVDLDQSDRCKFGNAYHLMSLYASRAYHREATDPEAIED